MSLRRPEPGSFEHLLRPVRVEVAAHDMRYEPSSVEVNPGDHVILVVTNHDDRNYHDLQVGGQRRLSRVVAHDAVPVITYL